MIVGKMMNPPSPLSCLGSIFLLCWRPDKEKYSPPPFAYHYSPSPFINITPVYLVFIDIDKQIMSAGVGHGVVKRGTNSVIQCVRALTWDDQVWLIAIFLSRLFEMDDNDANQKLISLYLPNFHLKSAFWLCCWKNPMGFSGFWKRQGYTIRSKDTV